MSVKIEPGMRVEVRRKPVPGDGPPYSTECEVLSIDSTTALVRSRKDPGGFVVDVNDIILLPEQRRLRTANEVIAALDAEAERLKAG